MKVHKCCQCKDTASIVSEKVYYCADHYLKVFRLEKKLQKGYISRKRKPLKERFETLSAGAGYVVTCQNLV